MEQIELDLDPKKVTAGMSEIGEKAKELSRLMQQELGEKAAKAIKDMEGSAEKGSSNIAKFFKNLGTRVKEDLKHAFDLSGVLAGLKFGDEIKKGVSSVFEMERAFDKLNTRLGLSRQQVSALRQDLGRRAAATGAGLENIMPGVEAVAAKGGVRSPDQLAQIGEMLGQARQTTGEDVTSLSESIVETIRNQGQVVNASNFKAVLDAVQATRTSGAFKTAGEAAAAIESVSPYAKRMGLSTRETGGLAAQASQSGSAGIGILQQLMEQASQVGGKEKLSSIFGAGLFKNGKLSAEGIGNINANKFGKYSPQVMESATGITGASGADLMRFIQAFKGGQAELKKVVNGSNETKQQFEMATDNVVSGLEEFREKTKQGARELGEAVSNMGKGLFHGNLKGAAAGGMQALGAVKDNAGTLAAATATTAVVALLAGGSIKSLMKGIGGKGAGIAEGKAMEQLGIQPVYVVNMDQMGKGMGDLLSKAPIDKIGKFGALLTGASKFAGAALPYAGAAGVAYTALSSEKSHTTDEELASRDKLIQENAMADAIAKGAKEGIENAKITVKNHGPLTNPSDVSNRGGIR